MDIDVNDPPHHRDRKEPCYGCGARWHTDGIGYTMKHILPCPYLEAHDYGGDTEIG